MRDPAHYYVGGHPGCLYCNAPGAQAGEPCAKRAVREAEYRVPGRYDPEQALYAAVFRMAWPDPGRVSIEGPGHQGHTGRTRFCVRLDGAVVAEAAEVGVEQAARVVREILESVANAKRSTRVSVRDYSEGSWPERR